MAAVEPVAVRSITDLYVGHPLRGTNALRRTTLGVDCVIVAGQQVPVNPTTGEPINEAVSIEALEER
jgi:hypothetical protein